MKELVGVGQQLEKDKLSKRQYDLRKKQTEKQRRRGIDSYILSTITPLGHKCILYFVGDVSVSLWCCDMWIHTGASLKI